MLHLDPTQIGPARTMAGWQSLIDQIKTIQREHLQTGMDSAKTMEDVRSARDVNDVYLNLITALEEARDAPETH